MRRVLFVDDEPNVLSGLRRTLRALHGEWQMTFLTSPAEALRVLGEQEFDVIVSDMRMPEMDGATLLAEVRARHPSVARVVLSGQTEHKDALRAVGTAHRFLAKPCNPELLRLTLEGVCALRDRLGDSALRAAVTGLDRLPSLPANYLALSTAARSPDVTVQSFAAIIGRDPAMSARVLQLVNSAFFGLPHVGVDLERAVGLLGVEIIHSLLLSRAAFDMFDPSPLGLDMGALWRASLLVARGARLIAGDAGASQPTQHAAYEAGLLHDVGYLVLATAVPKSFQCAREAALADGEPMHEAEQRLIGTDHGMVGAHLLDLWGLPAWVVEAVGFHHRPAESAGTERVSPLLAVHVACALVPRASAAAGEQASLDLEWLAGLGQEPRVSAWRAQIDDLCAEEA